MIFRLAIQSLKSRQSSVLLTLVSLIVSISVLISVEHIRTQAKESFNRTLSDVDLIVGARSGQLNLLLYSVFRMGSPTNNISWNSVQTIDNQKSVAWTVPISLGDSHRGYRVLGTTVEYFTYYKYANKRNLALQTGEVFSSAFDAVLGAEVAETLGYQVGDSITIAHGIGNVSFTKHDQAPFTVSGILAPTGTPVDKTIHITLSGIEAVHLSPRDFSHYLANKKNGQYATLTPDSVTALLVGLTSKFATFKMQRSINEYKKEALMAILPGIAMAELWNMLGTIENLLRIISAMILISSLLGLATMLLASMRERKGEMAVLRAIGAGPITLFLMIQIEAIFITFIAAVLSVMGVYLGLTFASDWLIANYGVFIDNQLLTKEMAAILVTILGLTAIIAIIPAIGAYRKALHTGLAQN